MRPGVVGQETESRAAQLLRLKAHVQAFVVRIGSTAPVVNGGKLLVWTREAAEESRRGVRTAAVVRVGGGIRGIVGYDRLPQIDLAASDFIRVLEVVQVQAM